MSITRGNLIRIVESEGLMWSRSLQETLGGLGDNRTTLLVIFYGFSGAEDCCKVSSVLFPCLGLRIISRKLFNVSNPIL